MKITKEEFMLRFLKFSHQNCIKFCPSSVGLKNTQDCIVKQITCAQCVRKAIEQGVEK